MSGGCRRLVLGHPLFNTLTESGEYLAWSREVTMRDVGGKRRGKAPHELIHITLGEVEVGVVQHLKVVLQHSLRHRL